MDRKENVLISACFLGEHCCYNGKCQDNKEFEEKLPSLMERYHLIPFCAEIYGGLSTPRDPAEIKDGRVITNHGKDVTEHFQKGAREALHMAQLFNCKTAILKMRSPSCGSGQVYDGTFTKTLIDGDGITAKLLKEHGIRVVGESSLIDIM